jgi:hypothetical protein
MARIMIEDTEGNLRDFSARQSVIDLRYDRRERDGAYRISDHRQSYYVTAKNFDRAMKAALDALFAEPPEYEGTVRSGRDGGVTVGELPGCARIENERRVMRGMREAREKYFGTNDDFFGTRNKE